MAEFKYFGLDSIVVSLFLDYLVEFDKKGQQLFILILGRVALSILAPRIGYSCSNYVSGKKVIC